MTSRLAMAQIIVTLICIAEHHMSITEAWFPEARVSAPKSSNMGKRNGSLAEAEAPVQKPLPGASDGSLSLRRNCIPCYACYIYTLHLESAAARYINVYTYTYIYICEFHSGFLPRHIRFRCAPRVGRKKSHCLQLHGSGARFLAEDSKGQSEDPGDIQ